MSLLIGLVLSIIGLVLGQCPNPYPNADLPDGFCAQIWANGLSTPRGMLVTENGDILVVERGGSRIRALWDADGDGVSSEKENVIVVTQTGINHGIDIFGNYLYASSASTLFRWLYDADSRTAGPVQAVVVNIPTGGHVTRTPIFDDEGYLYLSIGSLGNVDPTPARAQVRRFDLRNAPPLPLQWDSGYVWSSGVRNEVGLAFDSDGQLWGVMNGVDNLYRDDLGGDIHDDNPAEELALLDQNGGNFYGYPYCWAEYELGDFGLGAGTMWAHENFIDDGVHTDAWCQNPSNVKGPNWSLPDHTAPLDIKFWYDPAFGSEYEGDAFVALHGSWNRNPAAGFRVQRVRFENGQPVEDSPFLSYVGPGERWPNNFRPVALAINWCGNTVCLFVSSDATGEIVAISRPPFTNSTTHQVIN